MTNFEKYSTNLREVKTENPEDIKKIEAVIYAMAEKFLSNMSMQEILEDIKMTRAGKMLIEEGKREGKIDGRTEERILQIQKKWKKGKSLEIIAEELELPEEDIQDIYEAVSANPEKTREEILEILKK